MLVLNVFLALSWAALTGEITAVNLIAGFIIAYGVLWLIHLPAEHLRYFSKVGQIARFALYFLWELLVACVKVASDIVTPQHLIKPAILAIPIDGKSDGEITMLANVITLTPGTLSLDVSADGKTLYVHVMYARDVEAARKAIQDGFAKSVREVFE